MRILITGATGFVGKRLLESLFVKKHFSDIAILSRDCDLARKSIPFPVDVFEWNPEKGKIDPNALRNVDVVIHLAGENIADGRWSQKRKERILSSRVTSTQLLISEIKKQSKVPAKFISASAVGYYGDTGENEVFENHAKGTDFLAKVCAEWESALTAEKIQGMNCYHLRLGVVLDRDEGALKKMLLPFALGIGGKLGSGNQYMSWVHIDDLINQFVFLIENEGKHSIYNATAPGAVTNEAFTKILGKVLGVPTIFSVPSFGLKVLLGEMADMLLTGQRAIPQNFISEGFKFEYSDLETALEKIFYHKKKSEFRLQTNQWINHPLSYSFQFFSDEKNLEKITPPFLHFKVQKKSTQKIMEGTLIDYKLKLHGVPIKWQTKINSFCTNEYFVDEQVSGPYKKWVHKHEFISCKGGTIIRDEVVYQLPFGAIGRLFLSPFVKKDINLIFNYRQKKLKSIFL